MKKIFATLLTTGLFLGAAIPAMAQVNQPVTTAIPAPIWRFAYATPGHPVTLEGQGEARAHGRGKLHYWINDGQVRITGRGVVAVKGTNDVQAHGFGGKVQVGEWTFYYGVGTLKASGTNYEIVLWGKSSYTAGVGNGRATYRGFWAIKYHGVNLPNAHLETIPLPDSLKVQAGEDANLE